MTRVGFIGLGKVGLPIALAMAIDGGRHVVAYDPTRTAGEIPENNTDEPAVTYLLDRLRSGDGLLTVVESTLEVVRRVGHNGVVFVAVATPHPDGLDGTKPVYGRNADFDYNQLREALTALDEAALTLGHDLVVAVISTVAPGTLDKLKLGLNLTQLSLVYNPAFIRLGTVAQDFRDPDFVLLGGDNPRAMEQVWQTLRPAMRWSNALPVLRMPVVSAEMSKLACNSYQTLKITWGNDIAALCTLVGADMAEVIRALRAGRRVSDPTVRPGLGEGGPCRVRDLLVLDWLADRSSLTTELFRDLLFSRERQAVLIAAEVRALATKHKLPVAILGRAYKPDTGMTYGAPAMLVSHSLPEAAIWDPFTDQPDTRPFETPHVYLVGVPHREFIDTEQWPAGSVILDPWCRIPAREGVTVKWIGRPDPQ